MIILFLISISNYQKCTVIHMKNYISFGYDSYDLYLTDQLNSNCFQSNNSKFYLNDLIINWGNDNFITKETEVYQIQF